MVLRLFVMKSLISTIATEDQSEALSCIVLYLYIYIALLAVHTNQKRFQCERPREKRELKEAFVSPVNKVDCVEGRSKITKCRHCHVLSLRTRISSVIKTIRKLGKSLVLGPRRHVVPSQWILIY